MTPAVRAIERAAVAFEIHSFDASHSTHYGQHAAEALDVPEEQVFKTLIAAIDVRRLVVALVPAHKDLNLKSLAALCDGKRADLADPADAQRVTGYVLGGISPFGQRRRLATYVDASAMQHATMFVSGGRRGLEIELAPADLVAVCDATVGAIAR